MVLSSDLVSQFVKITNDNSDVKKESIVYGTIVEYNDSMYVRIDGSELLTPIMTTADMHDGERVTVMIKNHTATVTGNISSPAARTDDVEGVKKTVEEMDIETVRSKISEFEILIADKVSTDEFDAEQARIEELRSDNVVIKQQLSANEASISELQAENVTIEEKLTANEASISNLETTKLDVVIADATYATITDLDATNANLYNLESTYGDFVTLTTNNFEAANARIDDLDTDKLSTSTAAITYANIDFSNISKATMEWFYANSGLIENVTVGDGTITGHLVGVTITGDLIEGSTIKAEKLVIKGDDGLYYKLNTDGITTEAEQTDENSLNGTVIQAKSITASKISVSDLVAFGATIGGFHMTDTAIYSEVKDAEDNVTRGIYMDADGQINFGDESNFVKYYRDEDGTYKLAISAASILYALNGKQYSIADLGRIGDYVHIGTYEDEPCIELGESDSDFRLIITNTRIMFMEGASVPAYINNQSLHITKAVVEEEIQQGEFVWKVRQNGNMGLMWRGNTTPDEPDEPDEPDTPTQYIGTSWRFRDDITYAEAIAYAEEHGDEKTITIPFTTDVALEDNDGETTNEFTGIDVSTWILDRQICTYLISDYTVPIDLSYSEPNEDPWFNTSFVMTLDEEPSAEALTFLQTFAEQI